MATTCPTTVSTTTVSTAEASPTTPTAPCPQRIDPDLDYMMYMALCALCRHPVCCLSAFTDVINAVANPRSGCRPVVVVISHSVPAVAGAIIDKLRAVCVTRGVPVIHALEPGALARASGSTAPRVYAAAVRYVPARDEVSRGLLLKIAGRAELAYEPTSTAS